MVRILLQNKQIPWFVAMLVMVQASAVWAATTGGVIATAVDGDGLPVPGVQIVLTSPSGTIGGAQSQTSDENGVARFNELLPGGYEITASKEKFKGVTVRGIQVDVNNYTPVAISMEFGGAEETIEVIDKRQTVDVDNVTRGEVLTKDFLQKIPTGRTYQSAVQMTAGVTGGGGGNPNMGGASYNENTYMLDGVNITDPVTGTFSLNFNYDAIQQIEVMLGGYEPEYGVSLGGVINLVTESGTNNLQFDTSIYYSNGNWAPKMDSRFSADGFQISPTGFDSQYTSTQIAAKIAGPLIRDRAWFIFSYEHARSLANNVGVDLPRDYDAQYVLAKLTLQPSSEHRITTFLQLDPTVIDNIEQSGGRIRPEAQGRQVQGGAVTQLRWQWFLSPTANLDTQVVYQKSFIEVNGVPCTHDRSTGYNPCQPDEEENTVDWETPGRFGANGAFDSTNYSQYYFDDRERYQASTKLSLLQIKDPLKGMHDFKFGAEASQQVWDQLQGFPGNTYYYDLNEVAYDPQTFQNYYWIEITGPIKFRTSGSQFNLFAQDAWKPVPNLTIKYGLRYDNTVMRNDLQEPVINAGLIAPRAYAAWDPFGDQKTKIAGGYGRFNDTGRLAVASFTSASSYGSKLFFGEYFGADGFLNGAAQMYDIQPRENQNSANPDLKTPRVDEFILLLQRELVEDVSLGANFSYKRTRLLYEADETNVIYDEDGSAVIGARDGNPLINSFRLRTPTLAARDYVQADVFLDKVISRRWAGRATYTFVQSRGNSEGATSGTFLNDPQTQYTYGRLLDTDIQHQLKAYAYWSLPTDPWKQDIGFQVQYYSGQPYERVYYSEAQQGYGLRIRPRGVYGRLPGWWQASIKFSQDIDVKKGKVSLSIEANNLFNNHAPTTISDYYVAAEQRMFVVYRQDPLSLMLGARYKF